MMRPFIDHRVAAMALLNSGAELQMKEAQFLGGLAFTYGALSDKQRRWLDILLAQHALPLIADQLFAPAGHA